MSRWNKVGAEISVWWEYRALRFFITLAITVGLSLYAMEWPGIGDTTKQALFIVAFFGNRWWVSRVVDRVADKVGEFFG